MAGSISFPSGGGTAIYCWEKSKVLADGTKQLVGFVSSAREYKYPDGGVVGDYYYQRVFAECQTVYMLQLSDNGTSAYTQLVNQESVQLTATPNDIRKGTTAVINNGVVEGEKEIPAYHTEQGVVRIKAGKDFVIPFFSEQYDYTKIQAVIAPFNTKFSDSVAVDRVVIENSVYNVNSTQVIATISKDKAKQAINLGIKNNSNVDYVIQYFTYREEI